MIKKIVPMISSRVQSTPGILSENGILHLPRLHQKASLARSNMLDDEYDACGQGFDQMVLNGLGIDRDDFLTHINNDQPTFVETERWILAKRGGNRMTLGEESQINESVKAYEHDEAVRVTILSAAGLTDYGTILDAVTLNEIDDRTCFCLKLKEHSDKSASAPVSA